MIITIVLLIIGLLLIIKGGDAFVDSASWMAEKTGIPKLIIGATIVSLATTLPEMLVSFIAAADGKVDMAIGNAVGSVTANTGLIMGVALICIPSVIRRRDYAVKTVLMLGAALVLSFFGKQGEIGMLPSVILIVLFIAAMLDNLRQAKEAMALPQHGSAGKGDSGVDPKKETIRNLATFVISAVAIVIGSQLLVDNGSALATLLGVPERIIAISFVAIGTSLPELVTTLTAIAKKESSLSAGNIIGANIIDLTLILPVSALISGKALPISEQLANVDLPAALVVGTIALIPSLITKKFHRAQGVILVLVYAVYLVYTTVFLG